MACPFKTRSLWAATLGATLVTAVIYAVFYKWFDIPIMDYCYVHFTGTHLAAFSLLLAKIFAAKHWVLLALIVFMVTTFRYFVQKCPRSKYAITWALGVLLAALLTEILKDMLARYRPIELIQHGLYGFHFLSAQYNESSTPSGHTALSFAGFYGIARIGKTRTLGLILVLCALVIALSRIIIAAHYVSDVIFGAYIGILSVEWLQLFYRRTWGANAN